MSSFQSWRKKKHKNEKKNNHTTFGNEFIGGKQKAQVTSETNL